MNTVCSQSIKIIGKDTVVVLPIKEARDINVKFLQLRDSISFLKTDIDTIISNFTQYQISTNRSIFNLHSKLDSSYKINNQIINTYGIREKSFEKERRNQQIFTSVVLLIACVFAFNL